MIKLARLGSLCLFLFSAFLPSSVLAQLPDDYIISESLPPYFQSWNWLSTATPSEVFAFSDEIEVDLEQLEATLSETGEILLPGHLSYGLRDAGICSSSACTSWAFRKYKVIDAWEGDVWDASVNAFRSYSIYTLKGPHYSFASVVIQGDKYLIVQPFDDHWLGSSRTLSLGLMGQTGAPGFFGQFYRVSNVEDVLPGVASSPIPLPMGCQVVQGDPASEVGGLLPPLVANAPALTSTEISLVNTSLSLSPAVINMIDLLPLDIDPSMWSVSYTALANGILLEETGVVLRHELTHLMGSSIPVQPDSAIVNPDTVGGFGAIWDALGVVLTSLESSLIPAGLEPIHSGQNIRFGGGGVASNSSACTANKFRGESRIDHLFDMYKVRSYVHEFGHQFGVNHVFNANENSLDDFSSTQRSSISAYEPGSGSSIMAYPHNCTEYFAVFDDDGNPVDTLFSNHRVEGLMRWRSGLNRYNGTFPNTRYRFHTHSVEQMHDHLNTTCSVVPTVPSVAPVPSLNYQWGTELSSDAGTKFIPQGLPFVLSVTPEEHTIYRWQQMDLGPMNTQPDTKAMNVTGVAPRFMGGSPYADGKRFFPPRDSLFDQEELKYQYNPLGNNPITVLTFRVQANRFIPQADFGEVNTGGNMFHQSIVADEEVKIAGHSVGTGFGFFEGPWDVNNGFLEATIEIGEEFPLYQGVARWYVADTDEAPYNATSTEIVLVTKTEDALEYQVLYSGVPNTGAEGSIVLNLSPPEPLENGDIPEQYILCRPEGEVFFAKSPQFKVLHYGCTNPGDPNYSPYANVHESSQCELGTSPADLYAYNCKDLDACNYEGEAPYHNPVECHYPECRTMGSLNFSLSLGSYFLQDNFGTGYCADGMCLTESDECSGDWLDPDGSDRGWGFAGEYEREKWSLDNWGYAAWNQFSDDYAASLYFSEHVGKMHLMASTDGASDESESHFATTTIKANGYIDFDWQITESASFGLSNLAFFLNGEPIEFDKGSDWSTMWLKGDGVDPHQGHVSFYAEAGQQFKVLINTTVSSDTPVGVVLSDFSYEFDVIEGCMNSSALNYNPWATCDNPELCTFITEFDSGAACLDPSACNFSGPNSGSFHNSLLCEISGCMIPFAANFNPFASCEGPCCFSGDCDFPEDESGLGAVLWQDWNLVWLEEDPLPDFEEVMFVPGGMQLTAPQTTEPVVSQSVRYTYNGNDDAEMSFLFAWVPGEMYIPGEMYSPAVLEIWKSGTLVNEISLGENTGSPLSAMSEVGFQSYAIPPSQWPGDPFGVSPFTETGALSLNHSVLPGVTDVYRYMSVELTFDTEIVFRMHADQENLVNDDAPCRLLITGMTVPQNEDCGILSADVAFGCTDASACNYDANANLDNGSCISAGCMDIEATNYNPAAECQSTCLYAGDCANAVTVDPTVAFGFSGAFGLGEAESTVPEGLLIYSETMVTIVGPDVSNGAVQYASDDHALMWVADADIAVQFAYAVSSWDNFVEYDMPYYQVNGGEFTVLDEFAGDDVDASNWMVSDEAWQPAYDLMLPDPADVPYPDFEDNLAFPVKVLKTPIYLMEGDTLRIGVESVDNGWGEVVLALAGMVWTNHCIEDPEELWILGCKEPDACNYNPFADEDDGSCVFPGMLCDDGDVCTFEDHYNEACECAGFFVDSDDDGTCDVEDECPDNPDLSEEGVCGCETPVDTNGNSIFDCMEFCDSDTDEDGICDENEVPGCTDELACNYNASASDADGSCEYDGPACACTFDIAFDTDMLGPLETTIFTWDGSISSGLEIVDVELDFTPIEGGNFPSDLIVGICDPNGTCMEFGGYNSTLGYNSLGLFPSDWNSTSAGTYSASFDVLAAGLSGDGTWTFELKNTFSSATSIWEGSFQLTGTCGNPQPIEGCTDNTACNFNPDAATDDGSCIYDGLECACTLNMPFDVALGAGEIDSGTAFASVPGGLLTILVDLDFSPGGSGNYVGDLAIGVCDPNGNCIEVGGYNLDFGFTSFGNFPVSWQTASAGYYQAEFDVADAGLAGTGDWSVQFLNGYSSAGTGAQWNGTVTFAGLCDEVLTGCTEASACNYNPEATEDDGSCIVPGSECYDLGPCYVDATYDSNCDCVGTYEDFDGDGYCFLDDCDDNNPLLNVDCGILLGCTDIMSCNYDPDVDVDDGSCIEPDYWLIPAFEQPGPALPWCGSLDELPFGYIVGDFYCVDQVVNEFITCVNYAWNDFGGGAIHNCEGSYDDCQIAAGCMEPTACNYDDQAVEDDGYCLYPGALCAEATDCALEAYYDENCECNPEPLGIDTDGDGICDEDEIPGCMNQLACNYNGLATDDDGSCYFVGNLCDWGVPSCTGNLGIIDEFCECMTVDPDTDGDGVCDDDEIAGCQDPMAWNFDPDATDDDGSCEYYTYGCTDPTACNYEPAATMDDGYCDYASYMYDCSGNCLMDEDADGVCDGDEIAGCTDSSASNFNPSATDDDGSCDYGPPEIEGCTDPEAFNYDPDATVDDDSCIYGNDDYYGCTDPGACNYNEMSVEDDGSCEYDSCGNECTSDSDGDGICDEDEVPGCTDIYALNYDPTATDDDGSCSYAYGCTDMLACNYDEDAQANDGTCYYPPAPYLDCSGNCVSDSDGDGVCDSVEIPGCMDAAAWNFNPYATDDDGSCSFTPLYGCTDMLACNYDEDAQANDGTCYYPPAPYLDCSGNCVSDSDGDGVCDSVEIPGCMDAAAWNFNPYATDDDGSCSFTPLYGCTDMLACNYDENAQADDGTCYYPPAPYLDCSGNCVSDSDGDGVCDSVEISGCMDPAAWNYNPYATDDDGSCSFTPLYGCTDMLACNYDEDAEADDGTCTYPSQAFLDCFGECVSDGDGDGVCDELEIPGCMLEDALTYNPIATNEDGSCIMPEDAGCTYASACNYDSSAIADDGTCVFADPSYDCDGNLLAECQGATSDCVGDINNSGNVSVDDLLLLLSNFGNVCE